MPKTTWTEQDIRALGAFTTIDNAAAILHISRATAYQLVRDKAFPLPLTPVGRRWRVGVGALLAAAGFDSPAPDNGIGTESGEPT